MLFLEGRIMIVNREKIDIILFLPLNDENVYMTPINIILPNMNNVYYSSFSHILQVQYNKIFSKQSIQPSMRNSSNIFGSIREFVETKATNAKDTFPCTVIIDYNFTINDKTNPSNDKQCSLKLLIDITDTSIKIHWRKNYPSEIGEETVGSTDSSVLSLSYNDNNTVQFILVDPSDITNDCIPYIAVKETEPANIIRFCSNINRFNFQDISKLVLSQSDPDWIYNSGEYARLINKYSTETQIQQVTPIITEDNDEQQSKPGNIIP